MFAAAKGRGDPVRTLGPRVPPERSEESRGRVLCLDLLDIMRNLLGWLRLGWLKIP